MPVESGVSLSGVVIGEDAIREEVSHTDAITVIPVAHMLDTSAHFHAQPLVYLPRVVQVERRVLVRHIADRCRVAIRVPRDTSDHKVRVRVVGRTGEGAREDVWLLSAKVADASVGIHPVIALQVARVLRVGTDFDGVCAPYLGEVIREAGNFLPD